MTFSAAPTTLPVFSGQVAHPLATFGIPNAHRVVCLGDSQVDNNRDDDGATKSYNTSFGFMTWFQMRSNQALDWCANLGYSGATLDTISAHLDLALSYNPGWIICQGGGNDITAGDTLDTIKPKVLALIQAITRRGIRCVWLMFAPHNSGWTTAQINRDLELQAWVKSLAGRNPGLHVVDLGQPTADVTTGLLSASYTGDGTHLNAAGGYVAGLVLYNALSSFLPPINRLPSGNPVNELANITLNPLNTGTAGTKTGAGISGTVPTSWTVEDLGTASTTVCSIVAAAASDIDQCPWLQVAIAAPGSAGIRISVTDTAATKWAIGDGFFYETIGQVQVDSGISGAFIQGVMRQQNAGGAGVHNARDPFISNTPSWPGESALGTHRTWVFRTWSVPILATVAKLQGGLDINATDTVRLRRCTVRRQRDGT